MIQKDSVNLEYEARTMTNERVYLKMKEDYLRVNRPKKELVNINTYFDYEDLSLTNNHMVIRVREINDDKAELTLKIKGELGDIEVNHPLTHEELHFIKVNKVIPNSNVTDKLKEYGVDVFKLKEIVSLKTERLEIQYKKHLLVIDKNYYRNKIDYNVEVESDSKIHAKSYLKSHISKYGVEYKNGYISKSRRAIFDL